MGDSAERARAARALLRQRTLALLQALELAWPDADAAGGAAGVDSALYGKVAGRIGLRVQNLAGQLRSLLHAIDAEQPAELCLRGYAAVELACRPLFEECLALRQGLAGRAAGIDGEICRFADRLMDDLCSDADIGWRRFTVLATGESYTRVSDVIRVRFPAVSVWDLPVLAHELGHHAVHRLEAP